MWITRYYHQHTWPMNPRRRSSSSSSCSFRYRWPLNANFTCMERNDDEDGEDDDGDGQSAGKRCQTRIILKWNGVGKDGEERERERASSRRRQPFTCKSAIFFARLPPLATPLFITPWFFVPSPCASPSTFIYQFFFLFSLPFFSPLARSRTPKGGEGDGNSKQRYARKGDFNTLPREREAAQGGFY